VIFFTKKKIMWKNIWHYFTMFLPPGSCGKTLAGHQTIFFHLIQEKKREKKEKRCLATTM